MSEEQLLSRRMDEETEKELTLLSHRQEVEKEENCNEFLRVAGRPVLYGMLCGEMRLSSSLF
jgi:hypothetical protein